MESLEFLKNKLSENDFKKISSLENPYLNDFLHFYIKLCNPAKIYVLTKQEDIDFIRKEALKNKEEFELKIKGHTVHFDGIKDQARDKKNTRFLLPKGEELENINFLEREKGLNEVYSLLKDSMKDRALYVCFFLLGPKNSKFSIPCVQLTDSAYVAHSEFILYRTGFEEFKDLKNKNDFFKFVHSQGELDENKNSKNIENRRIYIDLVTNTVLSVNTQYGGNTIGLKKLALRLAIKKASKEGWLAEHMFIMGVKGVGNRVTYFTGAFPSMCGKTSTAMLKTESIIGDDLAYLRNVDGKVKAMNPEKGMFGILQGINEKDDPILWKVLHSEGEIIFSNVLVTDNKEVWWLDKTPEVPKKGRNFSGNWFLGKKDKEGKEILPAHKNARFTLDLKLLENADPNLDNPEGVEIKAILYGGRDSDTWPPIEQAFDWVHGVITKGASLESETTAATLGKEGERKFDPFSNLDFLSIPIGKYIEMYLKFGEGLKEKPLIFSVNYFLKNKDGKFLNSKEDKLIWLKWAELRVHREVKAIKTPTGFIPKYEDLRRLFKEFLKKDYSESEYIEQFSLRTKENLSKIDRIINIYKKLSNIPQILFEVLEAQKERILKAKEIFGDYISPFKFSECEI